MCRACRCRMLDLCLNSSKAVGVVVMGLMVSLTRGDAKLVSSMRSIEAGISLSSLCIGLGSNHVVR
jgi:hypothetical protein